MSVKSNDALLDHLTVRIQTTTSLISAFVSGLNITWKFLQDAKEQAFTISCSMVAVKLRQEQPSGSLIKSGCNKKFKTRTILKSNEVKQKSFKTCTILKVIINLLLRYLTSQIYNTCHAYLKATEVINLWAKMGSGLWIGQKSYEISCTWILWKFSLRRWVGTYIVSSSYVFAEFLSRIMYWYYVYSIPTLICWWKREKFAAIVNEESTFASLLCKDG